MMDYAPAAELTATLITHLMFYDTHFPCGTPPRWGRSRRRWSRESPSPFRRASLVNVKVKSVAHKAVIKVPQIDLDRHEAMATARQEAGTSNLERGALLTGTGDIKILRPEVDDCQTPRHTFPLCSAPLCSHMRHSTVGSKNKALLWRPLNDASSAAQVAAGSCICICSRNCIRSRIRAGLVLGLFAGPWPCLGLLQAALLWSGLVLVPIKIKKARD